MKDQVMRMIALLCLLPLPLMVLANVSATLSSPFVYYRGASQPVGSMVFMVDGNDFAEASPHSPIYLRVAFDKGAVLAQTLVDGPQSAISLPVFAKGADDPVLHAS
jgi:hypothetical protein